MTCCTLRSSKGLPFIAYADSTAPTTLKAQHPPQVCWFLTWVTTCLSRQSNLDGKDTLGMDVCTSVLYLGNLEDLLLK